jgi:CheY-like chemotaxis protein
VTTPLNPASRAMGAYGFSGKPVERETILQTLDSARKFVKRPKKLLAIEPMPSPNPVSNMIGNGDIEAHRVTGMEAAREVLAKEGKEFDCIVVDLSGDGDTSAAEVAMLLRAVDVPVILFAPDGEMDAEKVQALQLGRAEKVRISRSAAELQSDASLVLHRAFDKLPDAAQSALKQLHRCDPLLTGRKIVVIDDDIRNIFSLTSALEEHGVELHYAESGRYGIELLQRMRDADAALVDIMMPGMDGYQTIREIRAMPHFANLPIIAVTAKAMKGDRQKCIEAGASDYIAKPVDIDQLVSVLRVWLQRTERLGVPGHNVVTFPSLSA